MDADAGGETAKWEKRIYTTEWQRVGWYRGAFPYFFSRPLGKAPIIPRNRGNWMAQRASIFRQGEHLATRRTSTLSLQDFEIM